MASKKLPKFQIKGCVSAGFKKNANGEGGGTYLEGEEKRFLEEVDVDLAMLERLHEVGAIVIDPKSASASSKGRPKTVREPVKVASQL